MLPSQKHAPNANTYAYIFMTIYDELIVSIHKYKRLNVLYRGKSLVSVYKGGSQKY